jgi:transposase
MPTQDTQATPTRRRYTAAFKNDLVDRCLQPDASVLDNGINANVLFRWRRERMRSAACVHGHGVTQAVLMPVTVAAPMMPEQEPMASNAAKVAGIIEIDIGGARVRLRGTIDQANMRCVLQALRELA